MMTDWLNNSSYCRNRHLYIYIYCSVRVTKSTNNTHRHRKCFLNKNVFKVGLTPNFKWFYKKDPGEEDNHPFFF